MFSPGAWLLKLPLEDWKLLVEASMAGTGRDTPPKELLSANIPLFKHQAKYMYLVASCAPAGPEVLQSAATDLRD